MNTPLPTPAPNMALRPAQSQRKSRLAANVVYYHQIGAEQPIPIECRWSKDLATDEQLYQRRVKLTEEWAPLDTGWLGDKYTTVIVDNREGTALVRIPTSEEWQDSAKRAVEVSLRGDGVIDLCVLPGTLQVFLSPQRSVSLRCRHGNINCLISVVPE